MSASPPDPAALLRVAAGGALALLALVASTSWTLPSSFVGLFSSKPGIELVVTPYVRGKAVPTNDALPMSAGELRVTGSVPERCHLFVFAASRVGLPRRLGPGRPDAPGQLVGPGEFQVASLEAIELHGTRFLRFWAVCGPEHLRYAHLVEAALAEIADHGFGEDGVAAAGLLEGLPDTALQTTRLFTWQF